MKKSKAQLQKEAQDYFEEIHKIYPKAELAEVLLERYAGADMWIALRAPSDLVDDVLEKTTKLNAKWAEEKGISVLVTVRGQSGPVAV